MSKRIWIVRGVAALAFGSTAVFFRTHAPVRRAVPARVVPAEVPRPALDAAPGRSSAAAGSSRSTARSRSRP